jgi:hypothetical protein
MEEYFNLLTAWIAEAMEQKGVWAAGGGWRVGGGGKNINNLSHRSGQLLVFFREHHTCRYERKQILWYFATTSLAQPLFYCDYVIICVILCGHNIVVECDHVAHVGPLSQILYHTPTGVYLPAIGELSGF